MNSLLQAGHDGAFVADGFARRPGSNALVDGPLKGLRLAVKDVFQVEGMRCGAGNPAWLAEQPVAGQSAQAVQWLLDAGAEWVGKTVTDELTYSLAGINVHYGTPRNPAAPDRLPGGSSSGSVVAVAAGHADLALGTDCGGSVRLPASYCGVWGVRPSHGRVAAQGCFTLAHSFDTVGWFARSPEVLSAGLEQLLHSRVAVEPPAGRLLVCDDVLAMLDDPVRLAFADWLKHTDVQVEHIPGGRLALEDWADALRVLQAAEVWQQHGRWFEQAGAVFGADVESRLQLAAKVSVEQVAQASARRVQAQQCLTGLLGTDGYMLLPPVPGSAPRLDALPEQVQDTRARSQRLLCMAGLAGLPQVVWPWIRIDGAPVGLSLLGPRFADEQVMGLAARLYRCSQSR